MSALKTDIEAIYNIANSDTTLAELMQAISNTISRHPEELAAITYKYRLQASDTGFHTAFSIEAGHYRLLSAHDPVDVTVIGTENTLIQVFRRKLSPMAALLTRRIKIEGSKAALVKLGEYL